MWLTKKEIKMEKLRDNIFIFKFRNEAYLKRILTGGPWHFSQALIVLKELEGIGEISSHLFTTFWIQIKNVPIKCMDKEIFTGMGKLVDKIEEVDTDGAGDCMGQVIRLRISIDITQSLEENHVH